IAGIEDVVAVRQTNGVKAGLNDLVQHAVEAARPQALWRVRLRLESEPVDSANVNDTALGIHDIATIRVQWPRTERVRLRAGSRRCLRGGRWRGLCRCQRSSLGNGRRKWRWLGRGRTWRRALLSTGKNHERQQRCDEHACGGDTGKPAERGHSTSWR